MSNIENKFGEDRHSLWQRAVIDEFKTLSNDEIKNKLIEKQLPFAVLVENWVGDFNIGSCIRNANAFGAIEFIYLGRKKIDRRGACGSYHYINISNVKTREELITLKSKYRFVAIENIRKTHFLEDYSWNKDKPSLLIFGEEGIGITSETLDLCDDIVEIKQRGSVRSVNASVASGIAMHSFATQYSK